MATTELRDATSAKVPGEGPPSAQSPLTQSPATRTEATGTTPEGTPSPPALLDRLVPPFPSGRWAAWVGWLGPLGVALVAGILRFHRLSIPHTVVFDETYYMKDAFSLLRFGYEHHTVEDADKLILAGKTDIWNWADGASFVVHPPVGKWSIALGEKLFGLTPFGWRFVVAVMGTLSVLMIARIARRMTRSTLLGCTAGVLLTVDGLHYVESRTALLDPVLMFWVLAAFGCLIVDRDRARERLASLAGRITGSPPQPGSTGSPPQPGDTGSLSVPGNGTGPRPKRPASAGPRLGVRPWQLAAGVFLGLACGTKWSGLWFLMMFGLMVVLWDAGARRMIGVRRPKLAALGYDAPPAFASLVLVPVVVYITSWWGWFANGKAYGRDWADGRDSDWGFIPAPLRSLWHYHAEALDFHTTLTSDHPYEAHPWTWLVMARPTSFLYQEPKQGEVGCDVATCSREIIGLGTPALWWGAVLALFVMLWLWAGRRDWRAGAVLAGVAAGWLPWFLYQDRTVFAFYAVVLVPFLVLAVTLTLGLILGPPGSSPSRRRWGATLGGAGVAFIVLNFIYLYPILAARVIPRDDWLARMWLQSWI